MTDTAQRALFILIGSGLSIVGLGALAYGLYLIAAGIWAGR